MRTSALRRALTGAAMISLVTTSMAFGGELVTAELQGTANDVTVAQGTSATFPIALTVVGQFECWTSHTVTVDTQYAIDDAGTLSADSPSEPVTFSTPNFSGPRLDCNPLQFNPPPTVTATISADSTTPVGDYTITLSKAAGTVAIDGPFPINDIPIANGSRLDDVEPTVITVHVVPPITPPTNATLNIRGDYTNSLALTLDLAANDDVGITRYRVATSWGDQPPDLSSGIDVAVSSPSANFSANDVALALPEFALDGRWRVSVRFFDAYGNFTDAHDGTFLDRTNPVLFASTAPYVPGTWTDQNVTVTFTCQDPPSIDPFLGIPVAQPSEVAEFSGEPIVVLSTSGADQSVTSDVRCVDHAGNVADPLTVGDIDINKGYTDISPILQPINADHTSVFSRGKSVPVKFRIGGDEPSGFDYSGWALRQQQVGCTSFDAIDAQFEPVVENPSNAFRYDATSDLYIYNANFKDKPAGTCWKVIVTLDTGQLIASGVFRLQK